MGADWPALTFEWPDPDGPTASALTDSLDGVAELKAPLIELLVGDEPLAWIDDDVTPRLQRWAARRNKKVPTLLLRPNPKIGITMLHVDQLIRFIERVRLWREEHSEHSTSPGAT